ncbi:unnamed protein product, partial [Pleuronectes platessa]
KERSKNRLWATAEPPLRGHTRRARAEGGDAYLHTLETPVLALTLADGLDDNPEACHSPSSSKAKSTSTCCTRKSKKLGARASASASALWTPARSNLAVLETLHHPRSSGESARCSIPTLNHSESLSPFALFPLNRKDVGQTGREGTNIPKL